MFLGEFLVYSNIYCSLNIEYFETCGDTLPCSKSQTDTLFWNLHALWFCHPIR